jgi:hypothetical protein
MPCRLETIEGTTYASLWLRVEKFFVTGELSSKHLGAMQQVGTFNLNYFYDTSILMKKWKRP